MDNIYKKKSCEQFEAARIVSTQNIREVSKEEKIEFLHTMKDTVKDVMQKTETAIRSLQKEKLTKEEREALARSERKLKSALLTVWEMDKYVFCGGLRLPEWEKKELEHVWAREELKVINMKKVAKCADEKCYGLSMLQIFILADVVRCESVYTKGNGLIAQTIGTDKEKVKTLIGKLVNRGFLERELTEDGGIVKRVLKLTKKTETLFEEAENGTGKNA